MLIANDGVPTGIRCDITGLEMLKNFTYFSVSGRRVDVDGRKVLPREVDFDIDISEPAYKGLVKHCMEHLGDAAATDSVRCDLTGKVMSGNGLTPLRRLHRFRMDYLVKRNFNFLI